MINKNMNPCPIPWRSIEKDKLYIISLSALLTLWTFLTCLSRPSTWDLHLIDSECVLVISSLTLSNSFWVLARSLLTVSSCWVSTLTKWYGHGYIPKNKLPACSNMMPLIIEKPIPLPKRSHKMAHSFISLYHRLKMSALPNMCTTTSILGLLARIGLTK